LQKKSNLISEAKIMELAQQPVKIAVQKLLNRPGGKLELRFPENIIAGVDIGSVTILFEFGEFKGVSAWVEMVHFAHQYQDQNTMDCILHSGSLEISQCASKPMYTIKNALLNVVQK
jgi:hypothetical protein